MQIAPLGHMRNSIVVLAIAAYSSALAQSSGGFVTNIDRATVDNQDFRKVLFTGPNSQLVVMSLKPKEEIGKEVHKVDQFFRIEKGRAVLKMGGKDYKIGADSAFIVPAGVEHNVINVGDDELKLYTVYSPPQHPPQTVHHTKADALRAETKHG